MQYKRAFRPGSLLFSLAVLFALIAVGVLGLYYSGSLEKFQRNSAATSGAWAVQRTGSGLKITWNLDDPLFRGSRGAALQIRDGDLSREVDLDPMQRTGSLFYSPRTQDCVLRLRIKGDPERSEVIRLGTEADNSPPAAAAAVPSPPPEPVRRPPAPPRPMQPEISRSRTVPPAVGMAVADETVPVRTVRARAPQRLTRQLGQEGLQVDVTVKIDRSGKVRSASTRKYDDRVGAELAKVASNAALKWRFKPLSRSAGESYREQVLHFKFTRS